MPVIAGVAINVLMIEKKHYKGRFRVIGLRGKLLLATLTLLIFPLAGFSYLKELELFLKKNHSDSVIVIAKTIASVFKDNYSLIALNTLTESPYRALYSHPLSSQIIIDGYSDDWFSLQNRQQYFKQSLTSPDNAFSLLCANNDYFYYFLITVNKPENLNKNSFGMISESVAEYPDFINFQYLDYTRKIQNYRFKIDSPGWVNGYLINSDVPGINQQIRGVWQENNQGYTLEFRISSSQINQQIAFELQQQTSQNTHHFYSTTKQSIATPEAALQLNPFISTDPLSILRLKQLVPDKTQLWLLNKQHFVSAKTQKSLHSYNSTSHNFSLMSFYRRFYLFFMNYPEQKAFYGSNSTQISNQAISKTLDGKTSADWLDNPHSEQLTLSVVTPVFDNEANIIGTLILEQSNDTLLTLQDKTFEQILFLTLVLFFSVALTLLFFSTRLLRRIINLRNDTEKALAQDGEIKNQLYRNDNDEIGDLARSFSSLLTRLEENNQYLKTLSGKLSHELRTPLTIIKSSLENMTALTLSDENHKYTLRAKEGCNRLNDLLNRMSEASRLEESISTMEKEAIDVVNFLTSYIDSIRAANPELMFIFEPSINKKVINLSPELIAQLLDKLYSNAISYHVKGTAIKLSLDYKDNNIIIAVSNYGELIDENKMDSIFNSLTSYRMKKNREVHLGLGLYIANLITNFHNGRLEAKNNQQELSVSFILTIPNQDTKMKY